VYQAFPNRAPSPEPAPKSVRQAVYLMYAGAVVTLASGIVGVVTVRRDVSRGIAAVRLPAGAPSLPPEVPHLVIVFLTIAVIIGTVASVAVWLWMAWKCRAGRRWARIMSTVLFALSCTSLSSLVSLHSVDAWTIPGTALTWLIGLGAVILLWQRPSSAYFDAPRYY
jgi:hypothetical protein